MYSPLPPDERSISREELRSFCSTSVKTWIGGYRNRSEAWTEPRNWYPVGVPSWRDRVTVGGYSRHRCIIPTGVDPIAALTILPSATLIIAETAALAVDGTFTDALGILGASGIHNEGCILIKGEICIRHSTSGGMMNTGILINRGRICFDYSVTDCPQSWGHVTDLGSLERHVE